MKFLADMGVSMSTVLALRKYGHETVHLREENLGRLPDDAILEKARREGRVVLTFDLDFGDILAAGAHTLPSVIIFRLRNQTPSSVTPKLLEVISKRSNELADGAIIIVEDARYRLRRLPVPPERNKSTCRMERLHCKHSITAPLSLCFFHYMIRYIYASSKILSQIFL